MRPSLVACLVLGVVACSDPAQPPDGGGGPADMAMGGPPTTIIDLPYDIPPGEEFYLCRYLTTDRDLDITWLEPVAPPGVHHIVLGVAAGGADRTERCGPIAGNPIYASGIDSPPLTIPSGAALRIPAGSQIAFNLHLLNAGTANIQNTAALRAVLAPAGAQLERASALLVGPAGFLIDASRTIQTGCTMPVATRLFAVFPHMHQTGEHMTITAAGTVVWDDPFEFEHQKFGQFPNWRGPQEVQLQAGDRIDVTCRYTAAGVGKAFGDSSTQEMCFGISYLYPYNGGAGIFCAN